MLFEKLSEKPVGSSCTCTAGQGEACTQVAAMLFAMEDFTSLGHHELPDDPASTEILCAWNAPKTTKVDQLINNLKIVNMFFFIQNIKLFINISSVVIGIITHEEKYFYGQCLTLFLVGLDVINRLSNLLKSANSNQKQAYISQCNIFINR